MADPGQLSKRERQIMDVIYAHGEATVSQILAGIPSPPERGALRTLIRILERKGHVAHRQEGREFVYRPTKPRGAAGRSEGFRWKVWSSCGVSRVECRLAG